MTGIGGRLLAGIMLAALGVPASADTSHALATWTTLGTNSGPIPRKDRSEPANLLRYGDQAILVDAGDGASVQLAKAGVPLAGLHALVISHLHFDHTGGLFAVVAERYQMIAPGKLVIYGPPGTKEMVRGLIAAMHPSPSSGPGARVPPDQTVEVNEVGDGAQFTIGAVHITAAANTHYAATPAAAGDVSLSYRFDTPGRSITYTGDTGPSEKVEALARGTDLLVSEIIDPQDAITQLRRTRPDVTEAQLAVVMRHYEQEHLPPQQAGQLARRAGAKALALTHDAVDPQRTPELLPGIAAEYHGPVRFARDLDTF